MASLTALCPHSWDRLDDHDLWQCDDCGLQQTTYPHPTWRRAALGSGYVCAGCGVEPEAARAEPAAADDL